MSENRMRLVRKLLATAYQMKFDRVGLDDALVARAANILAGVVHSNLKEEQREAKVHSRSRFQVYTGGKN